VWTLKCASVRFGSTFSSVLRRERGECTFGGLTLRAARINGPQSSTAVVVVVAAAAAAAAGLSSKRAKCVRVFSSSYLTSVKRAKDFPSLSFFLVENSIHGASLSLVAVSFFLHAFFAEFLAHTLIIIILAASAAWKIGLSTLITDELLPNDWSKFKPKEKLNFYWHERV